MLIFNFCPSPREGISRADHSSVAEFDAPALINPSGENIELAKDKQFMKGFHKTRYAHYISNEPIALYSGVLWMACGVWVERFSPEIIQNDKMMRLAQSGRGNLRPTGEIQCIYHEFQVLPL